MKIIFMGTPDFAAGALQKLVESRHEIELVVTKPDCYRGKNKSPYSEVKEVALEHNLPVYQPEKIKDAEAISKLYEYKPDVIVVIAYGQMLSKDILTLPKYGCVNVHASLLPKYRGAAPIQWAVLNGDDITGVTTMRMDEGMDTGDIIMQSEVKLMPKETTGTLFDRLMYEGADLLLKTLDELEAGTATFIKQDESKATKTKMIRKEMGVIDFTRPAKELTWFIRGMTPWPSAYTSYNDKKLKLFDVEYIDSLDDIEAVPGRIAKVTKDSFYVGTGSGFLKVLSLQLEGKRLMDTGEFLRGNKLEEGDIINAGI
ncbi:MAG: methionyl-tRNA formyltransferase [Lachnospiraceae bacterium]|nr:methionyl-tRNA formyltransferase [Lachnospiraceae bacterium]